MHVFMNYVSLKDAHTLVCNVCMLCVKKKKACAGNVRLPALACSSVDVFLHISPVGRVCAAALTFPDESRRACPLVPTVPPTPLKHAEQPAAHIRASLPLSLHLIPLPVVNRIRKQTGGLRHWCCTSNADIRYRRT